jgi:ribonucleoside-diphosphate reductase alpha chain
MGHVRMMAAAQPFLSGAISKTVNLPPETTIEDIEQIYIEGWRLGLKAIAVYRDGSKASQVLHTSAKENEAKKDEVTKDAAKAAAATASAPTLNVTHAVAGSLANPPRLERRRLPKKRGGFTQEARVGGQKIYLRTGEYEDGSLGEVFIDMHKEGAALRSLMNCFAISVSLGLQHGVPLEEFVNAFTFTRFEPQGRVLDHPNIKFATSVVDYVFRVLGMEYLDRTDFVHVKPADSDLDEEKEVAAESAPTDVASAELAQLGEAPTIDKPTTDKPATGKAVKPGTAKNRLEGLSALTQNLMGDAPFCGSCGHITVRNGSCYRCLNCGNSMGCS